MQCGPRKAGSYYFVVREQMGSTSISCVPPCERTRRYELKDIVWSVVVSGNVEVRVCVVEGRACRRAVTGGATCTSGGGRGRSVHAGVTRTLCDLVARSHDAPVEDVTRRAA